MVEHSSAKQPTDQTSPALDRRQQRVGWIALRFIGAAIVLSLIMATIVTRSWTPFYLALVVGVPYMLFVSAPVWLARMTGGDTQIHNTND